jgi:hypothetical protein
MLREILGFLVRYCTVLCEARCRETRLECHAAQGQTSHCKTVHCITREAHLIPDRGHRRQVFFHPPVAMVLQPLLSRRVAINLDA